MTGSVALTCLLVLALAAALHIELRRKHVYIWLREYVRRRAPAVADGPVHILFCFVDHFEPGWGRPSIDVERRRVKSWCRRYPLLADRHRDADGRPPQHTFFFPEEEYRPEHLDALSELCANGYGEIEVHLHHDHDTEAGLRKKIEGFVDTLHRKHGALPLDPNSGRPMFGFIHGNWSLDNSRHDGRWCGVDNEISVLRDLGCYADFTLPSAPSETQTRKINAIYYAHDDPLRPKSHDTGTDVEVGRPENGDLMIIQGPLALNWRRRKWGIFPRIENADVRAADPPLPDRIDLWVRQHIHVRGRPEWVVVKVHTHGTQDRDADALLGDPADRMFAHLESRYNDGERYVLHYVTARELYNIIKAAEAGHSGNPGAYRDFMLKPPPHRVERSQYSQAVGA